MKESHEKGVATARPRVLRWVPRGARRSINRGIGGLGIELRKRAIRAPTLSLQAEGNMHGSVSASSWTALRSRRPQTRLETSCTRTGRPRGCLLSNRTAGRREKAMAVRPACTSPRVGQRHITYEPIEQRRETVGGDRGGKAADQGEYSST